jgi:colanic acid/amylovoran biosynthesis protein
MSASRPVIFVDHGGPTLTNVGDLAILMTATRRIRALFPRAQLFVPSHNAERLRRFCPTVEGVSERALALLFWRRTLPTLLSRRFSRLAAAERQALLRWPMLALRLRSWRNALRGELAAGTARCLEVLREARLFVAAGGGYLNELFPGHMARVLGVIDIAMARQQPVALFGHGLGPFGDPRQREALTPMLRGARCVGLRDARASPEIVRRCGGFDERTRVTGDDALELAWTHRPPTLGNALGLGLRVASYSGLVSRDFRALRRILDEFTCERGAPLLSCPIAFDSQSGDHASITRLVEGLTAFEPAKVSCDPDAVIIQVGRCRLLVTASYHAGVFALAQGIPVIGLAQSAYYLQKFMGLAGQFPGACRIQPWDEPDFPIRLRTKMDELWKGAEARRSETLAAAEAQISASQHLYTTLADALVDS